MAYTKIKNSQHPIKALHVFANNHCQNRRCSWTTLCHRNNSARRMQTRPKVRTSFSSPASSTSFALVYMILPMSRSSTSITNYGIAIQACRAWDPARLKILVAFFPNLRYSFNRLSGSRCFSLLPTGEGSINMHRKLLMGERMLKIWDGLLFLSYYQ